MYTLFPYTTLFRSFVDNHDRVLVEPEQRTVVPSSRLCRTDQNRTHDFTLLYRAARCGFLHIRSDHIADPRVTRGLADHTNHCRHARAAVVCHIQSGSKLYHENLTLAPAP